MNHSFRQHMKQFFAQQRVILTNGTSIVQVDKFFINFKDKLVSNLL